MEQLEYTENTENKNTVQNMDTTPSKDIRNEITFVTDDTLANYLREIRKYRVLTKEEEQELFQKIKKGDKEARDIIYQHNLRLVVSVAKQYFKSAKNMDPMDIIQEGNIGLFKAIEEFEPERELKFSTYAVWWIRQKIMREIANTDNQIRIPVHIHEDIIKIKKISATYQQTHNGKNPSIKWLAKKLDYPESRVKNALESINNSINLCSLDMPVGTDEDSQSLMGDFIEDQRSTQQFDNIENYEIRILMEKILEKYPERYRDIFRRRMGMNGERETLEDIGASYGITRERVRQIEAKILRDFRLPKNKAKFRAFAEK